MGQSANSSVRLERREKFLPRATGLPQLSTFQTDLGWFGLWGQHQSLWALNIGHHSPGEVRAAARFRFADGLKSADVKEVDWFPQLRRRLINYAAGREVDFSDCEIVLPHLTDFQQQVLEKTREIRYGRTMTYGQLAELAGYPGAARAVGSVMASNRIPIIIPCHRVVAAGGRIGGFSAPQGVSLKEHLLNMESGL